MPLKPTIDHGIQPFGATAETETPDIESQKEAHVAKAERFATELWTNALGSGEDYERHYRAAREQFRSISTDGGRLFENAVTGFTLEPYERGRDYEYLNAAIEKCGTPDAPCNSPEAVEAAVIRDRRFKPIKSGDGRLPENTKLSLTQNGRLFMVSGGKARTVLTDPAGYDISYIVERTGLSAEQEFWRAIYARALSEEIAKLKDSGNQLEYLAARALLNQGRLAGEDRTVISRLPREDSNTFSEVRESLLPESARNQMDEQLFWIIYHDIRPGGLGELPHDSEAIGKYLEKHYSETYPERRNMLRNALTLLFQHPEVVEHYAQRIETSLPVRKRLDTKTPPAELEKYINSIFTITASEACKGRTHILKMLGKEDTIGRMQALLADTLRQMAALQETDAIRKHVLPNESMGAHLEAMSDEVLQAYRSALYVLNEVGKMSNKELLTYSLEQAGMEVARRNEFK